MIPGAGGNKYPKNPERGRKMIFKAMVERHIEVEKKWGEKGEKIAKPDSVRKISQTTRQQVKQEIMKEVSEKYGDKYGVKANDVDFFNRAWASSSSNKDSLLIQKAAVKQLGAKGNEYTDQRYSDFTHDLSQEISALDLNSRLDGADAYVKATYENTQEYFKQLGFKEDDRLYLYRGYDDSNDGKFAGSKEGDRITISMNPLSSWSVEEGVANDFRPYKNGVTFKASVPIKDIFSTALTGSGCLGEGEVVVINRDDARAQIVKISENWDENLMAGKMMKADNPVFFIDDDKNANWPQGDKELYALMDAGKIPSQDEAEADKLMKAGFEDVARDEKGQWIAGGLGGPGPLKVVSVQVRETDREILDRTLRFESPSGQFILQRYGKTADEAVAELDKARDMAAGITPTIEIYKQGGEYTPERQALHDEIAAKYLDGKFAPEGDPTFFMTGGYPGSGKSSVLSDPMFEDKFGNYVTLDSDSIKGDLARADGIDSVTIEAASYHEESDDILTSIMGVALQNGYNISFDGTMKSSSKSTSLAKLAKDLGYKLEVCYVKLPLEKAIERAVGRFLGGGRFVDPEYIVTHDHRNEGNADKLKDVADVFTKWDNDVAIGMPPVLIESNNVLQ